MKSKHTQDPERAKAMFREMFDKVANSSDERDRLELPGYWVKRAQFHIACRKAGIACPENIVDAWEWEKSIGLTEYVRKLIAAHKRKLRAEGAKS